MDADQAAPAPPQPDEQLKRFGLEPETAAELAEQAAAAEVHPRIRTHGVSVTARSVPPHRTDVCVANRSDVEKHFRVRNTGTTRDPLHRTVELEKPVTTAAAELFNRVFGREGTVDEPGE